MDTGVEFAGLRLRNPTMLASGILGISYEVMERVYEAGAGAVISKSISVEPREGYRGPIIVRVDSGYVNAVGLANPGVDHLVQELSRHGYAEGSSIGKVPIIVNLVGSDVDEFVYMVRRLDHLSIIGYELNLSCPHVEKVGLEVGDDPELVSRIVRGIRAVTGKPVIAKLGLGAVDMLEVARAAMDSGASAVTAINTIRAMVIDVDTRMPVLGNRVGGLSGRAIKPVAVRCVYELYRAGIPVVGCGGIYDWRDAVEFMLAGAEAVQVGSAVGDGWLDVFNDINMGIRRYMERNGLKSVRELVGVAHRY
ncbi:MAG: dihydroorotate dehydrogenase [Candidatus Nitrosocaldus sp.]|nr:dihydroorotate dehydrogenase [Candidatus Nitrosocaldus sp.]MCS7141495.1 dihydroorotate dehydrogenase [Candidatus Nitrosocaldus sp.]MDW7999701.1 dihydroorotate dehydrogenase [Candidatus Nitrosocaldus sp.]MDW8275355.1 dihydroorotate dehydrogenase [Candidatus Nitrosocaldus sp.]